MSREEAERLLDAVQGSEDKTKEKVDAKKAKVGRSGKNWQFGRGEPVPCDRKRTLSLRTKYRDGTEPLRTRAGVSRRALGGAESPEKAEPLSGKTDSNERE